MLAHVYTLSILIWFENKKNIYGMKLGEKKNGAHSIAYNEVDRMGYERKRKKKRKTKWGMQQKLKDRKGEMWKKNYSEGIITLRYIVINVHNAKDKYFSRARASFMSALKKHD